MRDSGHPGADCLGNLEIPTGTYAMTAGPYILKVKDNSFINLSYNIDKIETVVDITLC